MARPSGRARDAKRREADQEDARETSALVLDAALVRARSAGARLLGRQRALLLGGASGVTVVALRGIFAVARGERASVELAVVLAGAFLTSAALVAAGWRGRTRMERLARDVQSLEASRDALEAEPPPRVEIRAQRTDAGDVRPVVVVRTDDFEHLFHKGEPLTPPQPSWSARGIAAVAVLVAVVGALSVLIAPGNAARHRWTFLEETSSPDELGFRMGPPHGGPWTLEADEAATGARALVNRAGEGNAPAATLVATTVKARDVRGVTRCRVRRDHKGGACGLVFRYADDGSHHVARVELDTGRVVLARVAGGAEREIASADVHAEPGVWYELGVEAKGSAIRVSCNGRQVVDALDEGPSVAGSIGLWAPSGTEAYFDELSVEVLGNASAI